MDRENRSTLAFNKRRKDRDDRERTGRFNKSIQLEMSSEGNILYGYWCT